LGTPLVEQTPDEPHCAPHWTTFPRDPTPPADLTFPLPIKQRGRGRTRSGLSLGFSGEDSAKVCLLGPSRTAPPPWWALFSQTLRNMFESLHQDPSLYPTKGVPRELLSLSLRSDGSTIPVDACTPRLPAIIFFPRRAPFSPEKVVLRPLFKPIPEFCNFCIHTLVFLVRGLTSFDYSSKVQRVTAVGVCYFYEAPFLTDKNYFWYPFSCQKSFLSTSHLLCRNHTLRSQKFSLSRLCKSRSHKGHLQTKSSFPIKPFQKAHNVILSFAQVDPTTSPGGLR